MAGMIDLVVVVMALASVVTSVTCLKMVRELVSRPPIREPEPHLPVAEPPVPEMEPEALCVLPSANDELLADLEALERTTRGAASCTVCTHWDEQDERDAMAEDEAVLASRNIIRRLPVRCR